MNQEKVTLKDIAKELGLSMATVDRALNKRGNVNEKTYRKILDKANELNYTPNKSASLLSRKKTCSVAFLLPEYPQHFWMQVEKGIWSAYEDYRDYGLNVEVIKTPSIDLDNQIETIQQVIDSKKFDVVALAPTDATDIMDSIIDQGLKKGIPICTINNDAPLSGRLFYVGCDYRDSGRLAAEVLSKFIGKSGKVLVITENTSFQMQQKILGFREALLKYPSVSMLGPIKVNEHESNSYDVLEEYLNDIKGIYVANSILGNISEYLEKLNKEVVLIGHDLNPVVYHYLKQGLVSATICQDPFNQGYMTVKTLFNYCILDEPIKKRENITKLEIVTEENAKYYL